jgi:hypothetical protein
MERTVRWEDNRGDKTVENKRLLRRETLRKWSCSHQC